jgi:hypothetical protein
MKKIEKLLEEADTLYGQAEAVVEKSRETARRLFLQGIVLVFKAFLNVNGVEGTGELSKPRLSFCGKPTQRVWILKT